MELWNILVTVGILASVIGSYYTIKRYREDRIHREQERGGEKKASSLKIRDISHFERADMYYVCAYLILANSTGHSILLKDMDFGIKFTRPESLLNWELNLSGNYPECRRTPGAYKLNTDRPDVMKLVQHLLAEHMVTLVDAHDGSLVDLPGSFSSPFEVANTQTFVWRLQIAFSAQVMRFLEQQRFYLDRPWATIRSSHGKILPDYD